MIANGRNDDGSWNWRTFGTGEGFTADAIITGYLSADRIEAGSITSTKLDGSVGAMIDLSDNESIKMIVNEAASVIRSEVEPEEKAPNMLWLDISGESDVLKRWDIEELKWVECVLSQAELKEIYNDLIAHESSITQMGSEITSKVSADVYEQEMANKASTGWVTQQLDSVMQQTASDIVFQFNEAKAYMAESVEPLEQFRDTVTTWQKFSGDGLE